MKKKILVVEDDHLLCKVWQSWLTKNGFDVLLAYDSEEGYPMLEKEKPDLLLIDILLPGLDGVGLTKKIRKDNDLAHIPIILMSAIYKDMHFKGRMRQLADDFMEKPFTEEDLVKTVKRLLSMEEDPG